MLSSASSTSFRPLAAAIFFVSGAAGMVYEISWARQFGNVFGHTVYTGAMVLTSFLGGMAVGYWLAGRYRGKLSPLAAYGVLEIVAAIWACLVPGLLNLSELTALGSLEAGPANSYALARVLFCCLVLLPTTAALGATWPMMAAVLSPAKEPSAGWLSAGYGLNTAGAMLGSVLATAFLLVEVGVAKSSYLAAVVSAACGLLALQMSRKVEVAEFARIQSTCDKTEFWRIQLPWFLLAGLSGFSILALEVLYLRLFSLVFHNSTYTFGAVVTVFLLSLAVGSALAGFASRHVQPATMAGWACGIGGLGIAASIAIFSRLTDFEYFSEREATTLPAHLQAALELVFAVVQLPVTALGMILPITWQAVQGSVSSKANVARLTAVSTLAGAVGSLAASLLLPVIGLWGSFELLVILYLYMALACMLLNKRNAIWDFALLCVIGFVVIEFNWSTMHSAKTTFAGERVMQRWESAYGWIDAIELRDGSRTVRQNLHYGFGSTRGSVQRDYRQGHLPLLLHGQAKSVLFLGMGTGQTAAAALKHEELISIDVVELIPVAIEAGRYLSDTNRGLVDHPRVTMHVNDARRFLRGSGRQFDVIVSDLFVPWESHTGYLYTVEHYRAGRASLAPGGLFCQWLPVYQMGPREFEMIASSFASVFPHTRLWWVRTNSNYPVLGLIGGEEPISFAATPAAGGYLEHHPHSGEHDAWLADGNSILSCYLGDWQPRSGAVLNTDEHPRVEFSAPVAHVAKGKLHGERLRRYFQDVLANLPQNSVDVAGFDGPAKDHAWRLGEQRRLLGIDG